MMMRHVLFWSILPTSFSAPSSPALVTVNLNEEQATLHYRRKKLNHLQGSQQSVFVGIQCSQLLIYKFAKVKICNLLWLQNVLISEAKKRSVCQLTTKLVAKVGNTDVVFELVQVNDNGKLCNSSREGWWKRRTL